MSIYLTWAIFLLFSTFWIWLRGKNVLNNENRASSIIKAFEEEDKADGIYTNDFYEIIKKNEYYNCAKKYYNIFRN